MNVSIFSKMAYENISDWTFGENEPKTNPIKPNCRKGKIDAKCVFTKDYEEKRGIWAMNKQSQNKPNSKPIGEDAGARDKIQMASLSQEDYL
ncbi:MAG: hypothetical protein ACYST5_05810 [Planctomycetota bacterium]